MGPLATEIVERFQHDEALRARYGEIAIADDDPLHVVELGTRQLVVVSARTTIGPIVLAAASAPMGATGEWLAEVDHVATLRSGAELWAVPGAIDLPTWVAASSTSRADRRRVGLALLQLGETVHRAGLRHGAVEAATVVVAADGEPQLLPWSHHRDDDRARLQALGVAVLASAVDRSLGDSFGALGLLRPGDLSSPDDGERWSALRALADSRRAPPDLRFALQRGVDSLVRVCGDAGASSVLDADVRFSAFHPATASEHDWTRLLVLAHHGGQATDEHGDVVDVDELVADLARDHLGPDAEPQQVSAAHSVPVEHGEQLTFTIHCTGASVETPSQSLPWVGPLEEVVFWLHPQPDATVIDGAVDVYVGAFVRGRIPFAIALAEVGAPATSCCTVDAYRDVFVSYAHEDRAVVDALTQLNTLGDRFLVDAQELRTGERWRDRLSELIGEAEVFQLFWSTASAASAEVEIEWRQALDLRDPDEFIRPVYWQTPIPAVPEPLDELHFDFVPLGGGGAPVLAAPVPPRIDAPAEAAEGGSPHPGRDQRWYQSLSRVAMVLVALFGFGAVFAGLVVTEDRGDELGELIIGRTTTPSGSVAAPTPPPTRPPDTAPPPTSTPTVPPTSTPAAAVDGAFVGPLEGTVDSARYPIELTVTNGPVTVSSIAATDRDGQDVGVIAPPTPFDLADGSTTVDVDVASGAGSIVAIAFFLETPAGDDLTITITGLP